MGSRSAGSGIAGRAFWVYIVFHLKYGIPMDAAKRRELRRQWAAAMFGEDSRGRILRATAAVVSRNGVRGITVQDILDQAELSRRTFYKYFANTEEALGQLFEVSIDLIRAQIQHGVESAGTPIDQLLNAFDAFLDLHVVGGRLFVALHREALMPDSPLATHRHELMQELVDLFSRRIQRMTGKSYDSLVYWSFILMLEGVVHHLEKSGPLDADDVSHARSVVLPTIMRALELPGWQGFELPGETE